MNDLILITRILTAVGVGYSFQRLKLNVLSNLYFYEMCIYIYPLKQKREIKSKREFNEWLSLMLRVKSNRKRERAQNMYVYQFKNGMLAGSDPLNYSS